MALTKSFAKTKIKEHLVTDSIGTDIIKGSVAALGAFSISAVGIWAVASLFSGISAAGGPLALVKSWFQAVGGF